MRSRRRIPRSDRSRPLRRASATVIALGLLTAVLATAAPAAAQETTARESVAVEVRVAARKLSDGRVEFALQQRLGGSWGQRLLPRSRMFPTDAAVGRWLVSTPLNLRTWPAAATAATVEVRVAARRLSDGRVEFALQQLQTGAWGERLVPRSRFFPADAAVGRWLASSPLNLTTTQVGALAATVDLPAPGSSPYRQLIYTNQQGDGIATNITVGTLDVDGANHQEVLTFDTTMEWNSGQRLKWSPDRSRFAYEVVHAGPHFETWVANADGSSPTKLSDYSHCNWNREMWSPDSSRLVLPAQLDNSCSLLFSSVHVDLQIVDLDGTSSREFAADALNDLGDLWHPGWSPDGTRFAYFISDIVPGAGGSIGITNAETGEYTQIQGAGKANTRLRVVNSDGSNHTELAKSAGYHPNRDWKFWSSDSKWLAYPGANSNDQSAELWIAKADGSNERAVTSSGLPNSIFWSPNGSQFLTNDLQLANADGTTIKRPSGSFVFLATDQANSAQMWSPDGTRLLFDSRRGMTVIDADGTNPRVICDCSAPVGVSYQMWSPDGTRLFIMRVYDAWLVNSDGTESRKLVGRGQFTTGSPRWSPDGSRFSYYDTSENPGNSGRGALWITSADGTASRQVADDGYFAQWSPTGAHLTYTAGPDAGYGIWVVGGDGIDPRRVSAPNGRFWAWSPDGAYLSYTGRTDAAIQIWVAHGDGTNQKLLLSIPYDDPEDPWKNFVAIDGWID